MDARPDPGAFEHALVRAREGDEVAFAEVWRSVHPPLLRWLCVVAPAAAEDIASEVWVTVTRGLAAFRGGEQEFRRWVFVTARRRAIDWGRQGRRRPTTASFEAVDVEEPTDASARVLEDEAVEQAVALLRRLRPDQAEVVALRVIGGLSVSETAAVVNRTDGAVRVLCHRGLRALAEQVDRSELTRGVTP